MRLNYIGLLLTAALGLSGCNSVISTTPLFKQGATQMRAGLWAGLDGECAIPADARFAEWPACAKPFILSDNAMMSPEEKDGKLAFVLSDTDPAIFQLEFRDKPADDAAPSANATPSPPIYIYAIAKFSADRPITDVSVMPLSCPTKSIPGLRVKKPMKNQVGDYDCTATTPAAVIAVAKTTLMQKAVRMVWIADAPAK